MHKLLVAVALFVMFVALFQGIRVQTTEPDDQAYDLIMAMPAQTPDGPTDEPSPIHSASYPQSRARYLGENEKKIANEVKKRGLINPGAPLGDLCNGTSCSGDNPVVLSNANQAILLEGFISCQPEGRPCHSLKIPKRVKLNIDGRIFEVPVNRPFVLRVNGISSCTLTRLPNIHYAFCELRAYNKVPKCSKD